MDDNVLCEGEYRWRVITNARNIETYMNRYRHVLEGDGPTRGDLNRLVQSVRLWLTRTEELLNAATIPPGDAQIEEVYAVMTEARRVLGVAGSSVQEAVLAAMAAVKAAERLREATATGVSERVRYHRRRRTQEHIQKARDELGLEPDTRLWNRLFPGEPEAQSAVDRLIHAEYLLDADQGGTSTAPKPAKQPSPSRPVKLETLNKRNDIRRNKRAKKVAELHPDLDTTAIPEEVLVALMETAKLQSAVDNYIQGRDTGLTPSALSIRANSPARWINRVRAALGVPDDAPLTVDLRPCTDAMRIIVEAVNTAVADMERETTVGVAALHLPRTEAPRDRVLIATEDPNPARVLPPRQSELRKALIPGLKALGTNPDIPVNPHDFPADEHTQTVITRYQDMQHLVSRAYLEEVIERSSDPAQELRSWDLTVNSAAADLTKTRDALDSADGLLDEGWRPIHIERAIRQAVASERRARKTLGMTTEPSPEGQVRHEGQEQAVATLEAQKLRRENLEARLRDYIDTADGADGERWDRLEGEKFAAEQAVHAEARKARKAEATTREQEAILEIAERRRSDQAAQLETARKVQAERENRKATQHQIRDLHSLEAEVWRYRDYITAACRKEHEAVMAKYATKLHAAQSNPPVLRELLDRRNAELAECSPNAVERMVAEYTDTLR